MDIDPREIQDKQSFDSLREFVTELSCVLRQRVRVTYENSPEDTIFSVVSERQESS